MENKFWEITSKWYFFPLLLLFFVVIYSIIMSRSIFSILMALIIIPLGYMFLTPEAGLDSILLYIIIFYFLFFLAVGIISYYKLKKQKILKWLIISLFVYLLIPIAYLVVMSIMKGRNPSFIPGPF